MEEVGARHLRLLARDLVRHAEEVVALVIIGLPDNLHLGDIVVELDVGSDPVHVRGMLHVRDALVLLWPCRPVHRIAEPLVFCAPFHAEPDVEGCQLGLQLGGLVGLHNPRVTTDTVVPVVHGEVGATIVHPIQLMLDAVVARPDEDRLVRVLARQGLEGFDALHGDFSSNLLTVLLETPGASPFHDELDVFHTAHGGSCDRELHVDGLGARLHREGHRLCGAEDVQGSFSEGGAVVGVRLHNILVLDLHAVAVPLGIEHVHAQVGHDVDLLLGLRDVTP
mmetsp:Transcript_85110/g.219252  ORF Transcript_85110/g.219252 Transcript_85110/m.219252 type:complete len:280 (+) Transcript_85110:1379-2218(+)